MKKVRPVKLRYRKLNGLRLRLIAERITGNPEVMERGGLPAPRSSPLRGSMVMSNSWCTLGAL